MKRAVLLAFLLAGCDDLPRARSESEIRVIARDEADAAQQRVIAQLEERIAELEKQVRDDRAFTVSTYNELVGLRGTFNRNVEISNREKVDAMTARGACGTRLVNLPNGGFYNERVKCTEKDLLP